eukprot:TRINITY_DN12250_c0_g2_i2.p1 TRINITY_DN12250_c0_g2~~TRINITY_DN12250_c0_g2_i2.p1  ORF type:complete len:2387 (+),score=604.80 TRINITY_DN12250_c0_g2_i2:67-7227(+)
MSSEHEAEADSMAAEPTEFLPIMTPPLDPQENPWESQEGDQPPEHLKDFVYGQPLAFDMASDDQDAAAASQSAAASEDGQSAVWEGDRSSMGTDSLGAEVEEQLGELPKIKELRKSTRNSKLHRKAQRDQMRVMEEERLKIQDTVKGFKSTFEENQLQMVNLERQVNILKERERVKALEIMKWQSNADALQKDTFRLKEQLALVTHRLAQAETQAEEAESGLPSQNEEMLHMRLADYESLVAEFADQANRVVDEPEDIGNLDPMDSLQICSKSVELGNESVSPSFCDDAHEDGHRELAERCAAAEADAVKKAAELARIAEASKDVQYQLKRRAVELLWKHHGDRGVLIETLTTWRHALRLSKRESQLSADADALVSRCAAAEAVAERATKRHAEAEAQVSLSAAKIAEAEEEARVCTERRLAALAEVDASRLRCESADVAASASAEIVARTKAEVVQLEERMKQIEEASITDRAKQQAELEVLAERHAKAETEIAESRAQCADAEAHAESATSRAAAAEASAEALLSRLTSEVGQQQEAVSAALQAKFNLDLEASISRCADAERQLEASIAQRSLAEADAQAANANLSEALSSKREADQSIVLLRDECRLAEKKSLRSQRQSQMVSTLFSGMHKDLKQEATKARSAMRELRRAHTELVVARMTRASVNHAGAEAETRDDSAEAESQVEAERLREELQKHQTLSEQAEGRLRELESAKAEATRRLTEMEERHASLQSHGLNDQQRQRETEERIAVLEKEIQEAVAAKEEVSRLQAELDLQRLTHAELEERAKKEKEDAALHLEELEKLRGITVELEQRRFDVADAEGRIAAFQVELDQHKSVRESLESRLETTKAALATTEASLAEAMAQLNSRGDDLCMETADGSRTDDRYEIVVQERAELEERISSLQDHLGQETEHFDELAVAHEEMLALSDQLKAEKEELERQLEESQRDCGIAQEEFQEAVSAARNEIARLCEDQRREMEMLKESFHVQLEDSTTKVREALAALRAEQSARLALEEERVSLASQLERERVTAEQRDVAERQASASQLHDVTTRCTSLVEQVTSLNRELEGVRTERESSERKLAEITEELHRNMSERELLNKDLCKHEERSASHAEMQQQILARETAACDRHAELEKRLTEAQALLDHSAAQHGAKLQALTDQHGDALRDLEAAKSDRQQLEVSLHTMQVAEATAGQALTDAQQQLAELRHAKAEAESGRISAELRFDEAAKSDAEAKAALTKVEQRLQELSLTAEHIERERGVVADTRLAELERSQTETMAALDFAQRRLLEIADAETEARSGREEAELRLTSLAKSETEALERLAVMDRQLAEHVVSAEAEIQEHTANNSALVTEHHMARRAVEEELEGARQNLASTSAEALSLKTQLEEAMRRSVEVEEHSRVLAGERDAASGRHAEDRLVFDSTLAEVKAQHAQEAANCLSLEKETSAASEALAHAESRCKEMEVRLGETSHAFEEARVKLEASTAAESQARAMADVHAAERASAEERWREQATMTAAEHEAALQAANQHLQKTSQDAHTYCVSIQERAKTIVAQKDEQIQQLQQRVVETEGQLKAFGDRHSEDSLKLQRMSEEHQELHARLASDDLKQQLFQAGEQITVVSTERDAAKQKLADANVALSNALAERDALQQKVVASEQDFRDVSVQRDAVQQNLLLAEENVVRMTEEQQALQLRLANDDSKQQLAEAHQRISSVSADRDTTQQSLAQAQQQLSFFTGELDAVRQDLAHRDQHISSLSAEHEAVKQHHGQMTAELDSWKQRHSELASSHDSLGSAALERDQVKAEMEQTLQRLAQFETSHSFVQDRLQSVSEELARASGERDSLRDQLSQGANVAAQLASMEQQLVRANEDVLTATRERDSLYQQVQSLQATTAAHGDLQTQLFEAQDNGSRLSLERDSLAAELQGSVTRHSSMLETVKTLQEQLSEAKRVQDDLAGAKATLERQLSDHAASGGVASAELASANARQMELLAGTQELQRQLFVAQQSLGEAASQKASLEQTLAQESQRQAAIAHERDTHAHALAQQTAIVEQTIQEREYAQQQSAQTTAELGRTAAERDSLQVQLATAEASRMDTEQRLSEALNAAASGAGGPGQAAADAQVALLQQQFAGTLQRAQEAEGARQAMQAELELVRTQMSLAGAPSPPNPQVPQGDLANQLELARRQAQEAEAERQVLETAFRSQMEEAQRSLSAKSLEAETLRRQLADANAKVAGGVVSAPPPAAMMTSSTEGAPAEKIVKQFQQRIRDIEEEKALVSSQMREHILQLARENYDLKQQLANSQAPAANTTVSTVISQEAKKPSPANTAATPLVTPETSAGGGGGWLSYVFSPFLTDSDMREIHAETYVDDKLGPNQHSMSS